MFPAFKALERPKERWNNQTSILIIFILSLFIGLRHEVGRDWGNYLHYLNFVRGTELFEGKAGKELLFFMISKLSLFFNFGVYGIPETILVDKELYIIKKYIGPLNQKDVNKILKLIRQ